jgi:hypothetical protein
MAIQFPVNDASIGIVVFCERDQFVAATIDFSAVVNDPKATVKAHFKALIGIHATTGRKFHPMI